MRRSLRIAGRQMANGFNALDKGINGVCLGHHNAVQWDFWASLHVDTGYARVNPRQTTFLKKYRNAPSSEIISPHRAWLSYCCSLTEDTYPLFCREIRPTMLNIPLIYVVTFKARLNMNSKRFVEIELE